MKGGNSIDHTQYNGWPNVFTWQAYTCLSSYIETYNTARNIVASATTPFEAEDALRDWIRETIDECFDQCAELSLKVLITGLVNNALGQVDWSHLARAFDESVQ